MIVNYREVKIAKKNSRILPINSSKIIYIYLKEEEDKLVFVSPNVRLLIGYLTCSKITILTYARR